MKKNKFMRVASVLLVLTLLSTCAISGTFAKYTTAGGAEDTARVAKWGVEISTSGEFFTTDYKATDTAFNTANSDTVYSVAAAGTDARDDVVAPGTTGSAGVFSITGTPEVAVDVQITLNADDALKMIALEAGTYTDYTQANITDATTFTTTGTYNPIKWTLKRASTADALDTTTDAISYTPADTDTAVTLSGVTLETIEAYLDYISGYQDANTNLDETYGYYELTWEWTFEVDDNTNKMDTYLGQLASENTTMDEAIADKLVEAFKLSVSVTQVD